MSKDESIEYLGIVAGRAYLAERGVSLRIPRSEVESIDVRRRSPVQHPVLLFLFGLVAVAAGLYPFPRLVLWWLHRGVLLEYEVFLAVFLVIGVYSLYEAVQRVPVLLVRTTRGVKKLAVRGRVQPDELQHFLQRLETEHGYRVSVDLP